MRQLLAIVVLSFWLSIGLTADVTAQQWTRFRGPNGTGISSAENIPVEWSESDYLWKVAVPGKGHSSPVVWKDRVFVLSADPESAAQYLLCFDTGSGKCLWEKQFESKSHALHLRNSFASSTPAVDAEHVYVAWANPSELILKAVDHQGNEVWSQDLGRWVSQHGFANSPILYDDLVILSNSQQAQELKPRQSDAQGGQGGWELAAMEKPGESFMMAFDRTNGELRWKTPRVTTRVCYPTPCIYHTKDGRDQLICYSTADGMYSLDPKTGAPNWAVDVFDKRNVSSPIIVGDLIFGSHGSGGGGNCLVAVRAGGDPKEAYRVNRQAPYVPTPVAKDDLVYLFSDQGIASCLEAANGKVVWKKRLANLAFAGSPIIVQDRIYCIDESGVVVVLETGRTFKELARNPLGELSRATPAVSGDRMYLRTQSQLFCVGVQ